MDKLGAIFKNRKAVFSRLAEFGFKRDGNAYRYTKTLPESGFEMTVTVSDGGEVSAVVVDPDTCIDCGVCISECPTGAISSSDEAYASLAS